MTIFTNETAMSVLREAREKLEALGFHCILGPTSFPQGASISLHVAETEFLATAAFVAEREGGVYAHAADSGERFVQEVNDTLSEMARQ